MITAIVFVKADVARIPEVAEAIAALEGVSEVYSVTGQIDLIALVRVRNHDDVAERRRRPAQQGARRDLDRDPHRLPRLLPPRPRVGVLPRPRLSPAAVTWLGDHWLDVLGWGGSALLVFSLLQARVLRFRVLNLVACVILIGFNAAVGVWPMVGMNIVLSVINVWFIVRLLASATTRRPSRCSRSAPDDEYLRHVLRVHGADILRFQPDFVWDPADEPGRRVPRAARRRDRRRGAAARRRRRRRPACSSTTSRRASATSPPASSSGAAAACCATTASAGW